MFMAFKFRGIVNPHFELDVTFMVSGFVGSLLLDNITPHQLS